MHIQHMQKALIEMNIRLPEVLSQIHGKSGITMIKAIIDGERNPNVLLSLCDDRLKKNKSEQILKALEGFYTPQGIFALKQALDAYLFYQKQIDDCDIEISTILVKLNPVDVNGKPIKRKPIRHHAPNIKYFGNHMLYLFKGKDATMLSGITDYSWFQIYTEIGSDLSKWPTEKHFTSWLALSPGQNHSGKKKRNARKGHPKAGQIFRQIAQSLIGSKNIALGAFGRRIRARKGPGIAIKAIARKLAIQFWRLMVKGSDFVEKGVENYERILLQQKQKALKRIAKELNVEIVTSI